MGLVAVPTESTVSEHGRLAKDLIGGLNERGRIKIGRRGRSRNGGGGVDRRPRMLDHFQVTTLERGTDSDFLPDEEVHRLHGEKPRVLPVRLLFDAVELNFRCRYVCFVDRTLWCRGDGETARRYSERDGNREMVACPCVRRECGYKGPHPCRPDARLSVVIDGINGVGGVWTFRTSSYNSAAAILSSMTLIRRVTGGPLAGIPLKLVLRPKTVQPAGLAGTATIWVVSLRFDGTVQELEAIGREEAERRVRHLLAIDRIEAQVRSLFAEGAGLREE